jgi:DNA-binding SARP family transcriptional activator
LDIEVRVLGPVEVCRGARPAEAPTGLGARLLLALAMDRGRAVDDGELLERLWPCGPPTHAIASLRNQVAGLRRAYGREIVERAGGGYRLSSHAVCLDLDRFAACITAARDGSADLVVSLAAVERALALVRGRPLHEVADEPWAMPVAAAAAERVAAAEELWADLSIRTGRASADVAQLRRAAYAHPHREVRWRQLVDALAGAGRRTEALRALGEARRALAEFGMLPGPELLDAEQHLLGTPSDRASAAISSIPIRRDPMVGRDVALAELLAGAPIVWIDGEPGSGKTRLLAELADRHASTGESALVYAACPASPGPGVRALSSLVAAANQLASVAGPVPAELASWLDESAPVSITDQTDADLRRATLVNGIVSWLEGASSTDPLTVVIDDVHWLDDGAISVLRAVLRRAASGDLRWILAGRRHETPALAALRGELERTRGVRQIQLGALTGDDLQELVGLLVPEIPLDDRDALATEVLASTGGNPLYASEMISHRGRSSESEDPPRLDAIIRGSVAALAPDQRELAELLAVAAGPCPVAVAAAVIGRDAAALLRLAERLADDGLLAPVTPIALDLRHDLIRRAVQRQLASGTELALRRRLVRALAVDQRHVVAYADQLLRLGDLLDDDQLEARDRAVGDAIERLMLEAEYVAARDLADRYLDLSTARHDAPTALEARLRVVTALIATGDVRAGRARLATLIEQAGAVGDDRVLADAILAMGPVATGGRERDDVLRQAESLAASLPETDGRRRVQLACWAAHHRLNRGDRLGASHLLGLADSAARVASELQGLILAVRAQADTLFTSGPEPARRSLAELRRYAVASGDVTADAAASVLEAGQAWCDGTLADVEQACHEIAEVATRMPRPDLQWFPDALRAAAVLAADQPAGEAVEHAARLGRELNVEMAGSTAMVQQLLAAFHQGELGAQSGPLESLAAGKPASSLLAAACALAAVEAGDADAVADVAARMAADAHLLVHAGVSWPNVAMCASEVAFAASHRALAEQLWCALEPYGGTGLGLSAAGYFGTVDRCLGLLAATLDRREEALALLMAAWAQEGRRGASAWQRRAAADYRAVAGGRTAATGTSTRQARAG